MNINDLSEFDQSKLNRQRIVLSRCIARSKTNARGASTRGKVIYDPVKVYLPSIKLN